MMRIVRTARVRRWSQVGTEWNGGGLVGLAVGRRTFSLERTNAHKVKDVRPSCIA